MRLIFPFKKGAFLFLIINLTGLLSLHAQVNNSLTFPSPNNSFLGAAGLNNSSSVGVDLYTGTAQVNVPIFNLASKELSIPISLNYIGGRGIRVQDYASFVGLGWQLNAGGSISRVVRGYPDEFQNGYLGNGTLPSGAIGTGGQWGKVVNNYFNGTSMTSSQSGAIMGGNYGQSPPTADGEPDLFSVKTPFFSFEFTFDQNGNPVFSNNLGYKIYSTNFYNSSNFTNCSFEVVDPQGNMYYFGNTSQSVELATAKLYGTNYQFPTTWYLTSINTYNARDNITFNYTNSASLTPDTTYHYYGIYAVSVTGVPSFDTTHPAMTIISPPRYLSSIISSVGEADFNYLFDRMDDIHAGRLVSVNTKAFNPQTQNNGTVLQTYNFNYSYFGSPSTDPNQLRLKLSNISVTGNTNATSSPLTLSSFTYYNEYSPMGSRKDFGISDYWGYLNYIVPMSYYPFPTNSRNPNLSAAQTYALNTITDLIGKTWNITYGLNDYFETSSSTTISVGGLRVANISETLPTGESLAKTYTYTLNSGQSSGEVLSTNYNIIGFPGSFYNSGTLSRQIFSEDPSDVNDINGNFCGYSQVKVTEPNGGYSISTFSNFKDIGNFQDALNYYSISNGGTITQVPDITSSSSRAYKRGLLIDKTVFTASGNKVSEDNIPITNYYSLTSPVANQSWGYKWNTFSYSVNLGSGSNNCYSYYCTFVENFRPGNIIHTEYDQKNPTTNSITSNTALTYSPYNKMLIKSIATTDSKGQTSSKTFYYPDEGTSIPMAGSEQAAISNIALANRINLPIHETDIRNSAQTDVHNSYAIGSANNNNGYYNTYLATTTLYNTLNSVSTLSKQQSFNFDQSNSNLLSSNSYSGPSSSSSGGKASAILYGYNSTYPIAKIENASSASTYSSQQTTGTAAISPAGMPGSVSFTVGYTGTITINLGFGGVHGSSDLTFVSCTLAGPMGSSPTLCFSSTGSGCSGYGGTATILNAIPGNYTLSATISSNTNPSNMPYVSCSYPLTNSNTTYSNEFFFEGFEQIGNVSTTAHTGNLSYNGSYNVPFILPNSRTYLIQWWSYSGSGWVFNEQAYTGPIILSGQIDDVRVFPTDALMTSYTYNPLVGKTSETDPSGRSIIYQYDGLNRLQTVRDQYNNILKQYDYEYQLLAAPAFNDPESGPFTRNNCGTGYIGSTVTYTVPANKYSSYVSKLAANQLAINDVNANGQNYANSNGTCTLQTNATISITNAAGTTGYSVTFTNTSTQANYTTALTATGGSLTVPFGTYNIKVTTTLTTGILVNWCTVATGHTATGSSVTLLAKTVSATGCLSLTVNSYQ
jgi:hypothetical protein